MKNPMAALCSLVTKAPSTRPLDRFGFAKPDGQRGALPESCRKHCQRPSPKVPQSIPARPASQVQGATPDQSREREHWYEDKVLEFEMSAGEQRAAGPIAGKQSTT